MSPVSDRSFFQRVLSGDLCIVLKNVREIGYSRIESSWRALHDSNMCRMEEALLASRILSFLKFNKSTIHNLFNLKNKNLIKNKRKKMNRSYYQVPTNLQVFHVHLNWVFLVQDTLVFHKTRMPNHQSLHLLWITQNQICVNIHLYQGLHFQASNLKKYNYPNSKMKQCKITLILFLSLIDNKKQIIFQIIAGILRFN